MLLCCCVVQVFWYFPLKAQVATLLKNEKYRHLLMHETRRARNPAYMSDVYDTPRWKKVAGPPTKHLTRIVYQICVDGFPWSKRKHLVCTPCLLSSCLLSSCLLCCCIWNYWRLGLQIVKQFANPNRQQFE